MWQKKSGSFLFQCRISRTFPRRHKNNFVPILQTAASRIIFNLHPFKKRLRNKERFFSKKGVKHFLNKKVAKGLLRTCQRIYASFSTRMYVSDLMLPTPDGWLTRPRARLGKDEKEEKEEEENNNYARKGDLNTAGARGGVLSTAAVSTGDLNFYVFGEKKLFFCVLCWPEEELPINHLEP